MHDYSGSMWSRADLWTTHWPLPSDTGAKKRAWNKPVSPSPWQRWVGSSISYKASHWASVRCCQATGDPGHKAMPGMCCCHPSASHVSHHDFSWRPTGTRALRCPRLALVCGCRKAWQLPVKAGGGGKDGWRHHKQLLCCFLPTLSSPWPISRGFMVRGIVYLAQEGKKEPHHQKKKET